MTWRKVHGSWLLRSHEGRLLGRVYPQGSGWVAHSEELKFQTAPGKEEWAMRTLRNFCLRVYPEVRLEQYDDATLR